MGWGGVGMRGGRWAVSSKEVRQCVGVGSGRQSRCQTRSMGIGAYNSSRKKGGGGGGV